MAKTHPQDKAPNWTKQTTLERFEMCRRMLVIHGFLSEAENERVRARLEKWVLKNQTGKDGE